MRSSPPVPSRRQSRHRNTGTVTRGLRMVLVAGGLAVALQLTGCATGGYTYVKTISTGERLHFPLVRGVPELAKSGDIQIMHAALIPGPNREKKEVVYLFAFLDQSPQPPKSVVVEDVSDDTAKLMVEDHDPKLNKQRWAGYSRIFVPDDAGLHWLTYLDDSVRVFQFTITSATGQKTVLHQAWIVPAPMKAAMRNTLGIK